MHKNQKNMPASLATELSEDESILWRGGIEFNYIIERGRKRNLVLALAVIILVGSFSIGIDFDLPPSPSPAWFIVVVSIFLLLGIIDQRLSRSRAKRQLDSVVYVLTNRRAICTTGEKDEDIHSFPLGELQIIEKRCTKEGVGDLVFSKEITTDDDNDPFTMEFGFIGIADVKKVEKLIRDAQANLPTIL